MNFFESIKRRMPHFFNEVSVLEYVPHNKSKSIKNLFLDCKYIVIDPTSTNLSDIDDNCFNVVFSINHFQDTPNYLLQIKEMHRVSSKFVMFSCRAPGSKQNSKDKYYKNLNESDFYNWLDLDSMFETYVFEIDYPTSMMYFWGVKKFEYLKECEV
jgi:ubiquinone/menaquinone biosynthesis C-methylase UbiE